MDDETDVVVTGLQLDCVVQHEAFITDLVQGCLGQVRIGSEREALLVCPGGKGVDHHFHIQLCGTRGGYSCVRSKSYDERNLLLRARILRRFPSHAEGNRIASWDRFCWSLCNRCRRFVSGGRVTEEPLSGEYSNSFAFHRNFHRAPIGAAILRSIIWHE